MKRLRYCLDTSAVNHLLDDPCREEIVQALGTVGGYAVTALNVLEAACTPETNRRVSLLSFLDRLRRDTVPVPMPTDLLKGSLVAAHEGRTRIKLRVPPELLQSLEDPESITETIRQELLQWKKNLEHPWEKKHSLARDRFNNLFEQEPSDRRPATAAQWLKGFSEWDDLDWLCGKIYSTLTESDPPDDLDAPALRSTSEHLRIYLFTLGHSIFHRAIKTKNYGKAGKPKTVDYWFSLYLPSCDWFFTSDSGQYRALRQARVLQKRCSRIVDYDQWRKRVII